MSSRALRRLREDLAKKQHEDTIDEEESSDSDEEPTARAKPNFTLFDSGSDSDSDEASSSSEEEEEDEEVHDNDSSRDENKDENVGNTSNSKSANQKETKNPKSSTAAVQEIKEEDEFDAILNEFTSLPPPSDATATTSNSTPPKITAHSILLPPTLDTRDFDLDYSLRTLLGGAGADVGPPATPQHQNGPSQSNRRRGPKRLFGYNPSVTPPHYIGGGIGMELSPAPPPFPYYGGNDGDVWFRFRHSDTFEKIQRDYEAVTSAGNVNHLALFVAENPYHTKSVLQLAMVFYRTGDMERGRELLRRAVQIWEGACSREVLSFEKEPPGEVLMDESEESNEGWFAALWRLMQISWMVGCLTTSLAVGRFLLSLDPQRDPMGVLLVLDYLALASASEEHDEFIIRLIESDTIQIHYLEKSNEEEEHLISPLRHLANWAFSYALALHRRQPSSKAANKALMDAINLHPVTFSNLLRKIKVDTNSRSCRTDWSVQLQKIPKTEPYECPTTRKIRDIFIERHSVLWSSDETIRWIYEAIDDYDMVCDESGHPPLPPAKKALQRYSKVDPSDYKDRFQTLPPEANPLDPELVAPAMAVHAGGRGHLRRRREGEMEQEQMMRRFMEMNNQFADANLTAIDPDDPMLQVFLRSLLPWNTVQGAAARGGG